MHVWYFRAFSALTASMSTTAALRERANKFIGFGIILNGVFSQGSLQ
jgi:hypothetical protein